MERLVYRLLVAGLFQDRSEVKLIIPLILIL